MKLKKIFLVFTILLVTLGPSPVLASENNLQAINMEIYINQEGTAVVKETWRMNAFDGTENYKAFNDLHGTTITDFSVIDEKGTTYQFVDDWDIKASRQAKKNKCGVVETDDGYELCYGIGDYGWHTYTMTYTLDPFINQYDDAQGFNWRLINEDMDPKPAEFKAVIRSDYKFFDQDTDIWGFGYEGQVIFDDQGAIILSNRDMDSNRLGDINYVNILTRVPNETYRNGVVKNESFETVLEDARNGSSYQEDARNNSFLMYLIMAAVIGVAAIIIIVIIVSKAKKDKQLCFSDGYNDIPSMSDVNPFRDIPCNKDIYYFYFVATKAGIINNDDRSGVLCAMLLKWIRDGYVNFTVDPGTGWFKKDKYELDFSQDIPTVNFCEEKMLGYLRAASGTNQILENKEFERWCKDNYEKIENWFEELLKFEEKQLEKNGLVKTKTSYKKILGIDVANEKLVYEPAFRDDIIYTKGLKRFLLDFSSIEEKEVIEVKLWEEYLMFASILGIADKVEKQIGQLCPDFNKYSKIDYNYTPAAARTFMYGGVRSAFAAYSAAHSSSYSGGGGFSSFSGGGGGFSGGGGGGSR